MDNTPFSYLSFASNKEILEPRIARVQNASTVNRPTYNRNLAKKLCHLFRFTWQTPGIHLARFQILLWTGFSFDEVVSNSVFKFTIKTFYPTFHILKILDYQLRLWTLYRRLCLTSRIITETVISVLYYVDLSVVWKSKTMKDLQYYFPAILLEWLTILEILLVCED